MASRSTVRTTGQTEMDGLLAAVPSSLTSVSTTDSWIFQISVSNTTAGAVTFLVQDRQTVPVALVPTISIPANTLMVMNFPEGQFMSSGISWQAGAGSSLTGAVTGLKK